MIRVGRARTLIARLGGTGLIPTRIAFPAPTPPMALILVLLLASLSGCGPSPTPRYHLGTSYQAGGTWHYPRESYDLDETGLGTTLSGNHPWAPGGRLTSNGERYDPSAMAASHPTLQLPAIARLTNLENGLSVVVRINDRGTGNPRRLVEFTPRVATLLRVAPGAAVQMRLTVLPQESRDAVAAMAGAPSLSIAAAPRGQIEVAALAPPPGIAGHSGPAIMSAPVEARLASQAASQTPAPTRLPEIVTQETPRPGRLMVRLGTFEEYRNAMIQRARVAGLGPDMVQFREGRTRQYRIELGPFATVAQADAAQSQAIALGVPDARIVID